MLRDVARSPGSWSEATGVHLAEAGYVATNAMVIVGITAGEMKKAVDGITGVVTSSQFDFNDYALALSQGGAVAQSAGMDFKEFNAAITTISSSFSSGSDAGTSLKSMMLSMIPTTKKAAEAMKEHNLQFYDAHGDRKSTRL